MPVIFTLRQAIGKTFLDQKNITQLFDNFEKFTQQWHQLMSDLCRCNMAVREFDFHRHSVPI